MDVTQFYEIKVPSKEGGPNSSGLVKALSARDKNIQYIKNSLLKRFDITFVNEFKFERHSDTRILKFKKTLEQFVDAKCDERFLNLFISRWITIFEVHPLPMKVNAQGDDEVLPDAGLVTTSTSTVTSLTEDTQPASAVVVLDSNNAPASSTQDDDLDLVNALSRVVPISQDIWSSTDAAMTRTGPNAPFMTMTFPQDIIAASTVVADKLRNFRYLRADLHVRIKVNNNPFQQGVLLVVYQPFESLLDPSRVVSHLAALTTFPHALINLRERDEVTMRLPYCSDEEYFDLENQNRGEFGELRVYILVPLAGSVSPTDVSIAAFAGLVNPKVHGPYLTDATATRRSNIGVASRNAITARSRIVNAQADDEVVEEAKTGMVTKILDNVHKISNIAAPFTMEVPILGQLVPALSWASSLGGKIAAHYGWSKSTSLLSNTRYTYQPASGSVNYDGKDNSVKIAGSVTNCVDITPAVSSKYDEMDFAYIFSRKIVVEEPSVWDATDPTGTQIFSIRNTAIYNGQNNNNADVYGGGMEYIAGQFLYWRGGIEYEVHVASTPVTTGRFVLLFNPVDDLFDMALDDMDKVYCKICDISKQSVFKFNVPYVSATPYMGTIRPSPEDMGYFTGILNARVLNPLRAPASAPQSVNVFWYKNFSSDFEVAAPNTAFSITSHLAPVSLATKGEPGPNYSRSYVEAQAGEDSGEMREITSTSFLDNLSPIGVEKLIPTHQVRVDTACMGERIRSVRSMIKRFQQQQGLALTSFGGAANKSKFCGNVLDPYVTSTAHDYVAPCIVNSFLYRFGGGSSRHKLIGNEHTLVVSNSRIMPTNTDSGAMGPTAYFTKHNDIVEFELPYYSKTRLTVLGTQRERINTNTDRWNREVNVTAMQSSADIIHMSQYGHLIAAGDDVNLSFLVGPPVWRLNPNNSLYPDASP